jgi:hypothetical protein
LFAENVPFYARSPSLNRSISPQDVHIDLDNFGVKYYHLVSKQIARSSADITNCSTFLLIHNTFSTFSLFFSPIFAYKGFMICSLAQQPKTDFHI